MKEATIKQLVLGCDFDGLEAAGLRVVRMFPTTDSWRVIYQRSVVGYITEYRYANKLAARYVSPAERREIRNAQRAQRRTQQAEYLREREEVLSLLSRGVPLGHTPGQLGGTLWPKRPQSKGVSARGLFMRATGARMNTLEDWDGLEEFVKEATNPTSSSLKRRRTPQWLRDAV